MGKRPLDAVFSPKRCMAGGTEGTFPSAAAEGSFGCVDFLPEERGLKQFWDRG